MTRGAHRGSPPSTPASRSGSRSTRVTGEYEDAAACYELDPAMADEIEASIVPAARRARPPPGGGALQRRVRRRRRRRHAPVRYRRHRRAGLDGDDAAHVRALGRRARLQGRAARSEPGRGGRPEERHVHDRGRERLRDPEGRARQAPARPPLAVRRRPPPADLVRDRDRRAAPARRRRRSRSTKAT